jgi:hypothetical protein
MEKILEVPDPFRNENFPSKPEIQPNLLDDDKIKSIDATKTNKKEA